MECRGKIITCKQQTLRKTSWNFVGRIVYCGLSVFYVRHAAGEDAEAKLV